MALRLFARFGIVILTVCLLLAAAVRVFGSRQPADDTAWTNFGFSACALPCFAGITLGETAFSDTSPLLTRHVPALDPRLIASGTSVNFFARVPSQQLGGMVRYQQGGQVGEIRINVNLPVERLFAQLGAPDCILMSESGAEDSTIIFWEQGAISVAAVLGAEQDAVRMGTSVFALWLRVASPPDCALRCARAWHGFAPLWDYKTNGSSS